MTKRKTPGVSTCAETTAEQVEEIIDDHNYDFIQGLKKDMTGIIEDLEDQIKKLEKENQELEERNSQLEEELEKFENALTDTLSEQGVSIGLLTHPDPRIREAATSVYKQEK